MPRRRLLARLLDGACQWPKPGRARRGESRCEMTDDRGGKDQDVPKEDKAVGGF